MLKVISENTIIADYAIYNKVNSIEELVALTKVKNIYFMAFTREDVVEGSELNEDCISMFRVEDFCCEEDVPYEHGETLDRNTEIVSKWFIHCNKYGWVPFWENSLPNGSNMEITPTSHTTLRSDIHVGQTVWFASGFEIMQGTIKQVCLRTEMEKTGLLYTAILENSLRSLGINAHFLENERLRLVINRMKKGFVIVYSTELYKSEFNMVEDSFNYDNKCLAMIPLDKVLTHSPF